MNKSVNNAQWGEYLETPCHKQTPVKLEVIVAARIEAFMKAKKLRLRHLQSGIDIEKD